MKSGSEETHLHPPVGSPRRWMAAETYPRKEVNMVFRWRKTRESKLSFPVTGELVWCWSRLREKSGKSRLWWCWVCLHTRCIMNSRTSSFVSPGRRPAYVVVGLSWTWVRVCACWGAPRWNQASAQVLHSVIPEEHFHIHVSQYNPWWEFQPSHFAGWLLTKDFRHCIHLVTNPSFIWGFFRSLFLYGKLTGEDL